MSIAHRTFALRRRPPARPAMPVVTPLHRRHGGLLRLALALLAACAVVTAMLLVPGTARAAAPGWASFEQSSAAPGDVVALPAGVLADGGGLLPDLGGDARRYAQAVVIAPAVSPVPEPGTWALMLAGAAALALRARRRR